MILQPIEWESLKMIRKKYLDLTNKHQSIKISQKN